MHFPNTTAMMKNLQDDSRITLDQVMQLIEKLFADVQYQTGDLVEDCQIGDMHQLVPTLSAVTNDIVYIFRNHEQEISDAQHKYFNSLTKAQTACAVCLEQLQGVQSTIESLEQEEAQLIQRKQEAELLQKSTGELTQRVQALQAQIRQLTPDDGCSDAGKLRQEISCLEEQLKALESRFAADQTIASDLQAKISGQQTQISQAEQKNLHLEHALCTLDTQLQALIVNEESLNQTIADKQQQVRNGIEQQNAKTAQLERIQAVINQHTETLAKQDTELAELSSREAGKAQEVARNQEQLDALKQRLDANEKLLADHQNEYQNVQARLKHAQDSLQQTRTEIAGIQETIQEAEQVLAEERTQAETLKTTLFNTNSDVEYQKADNENYRKQFLEPAEAQLASLKAQIDENQKRYQELQAELEQTKATRSTTVSANQLLESNIFYAKQDLHKQEELQKQQTEQFQQLEAALREKARAVEALINDQNRLRELLNGRDTNQIRQNLEDENEQLEKDIREADALEVQIRQVQADLNTAQERRDQVRGQLEGILAEQKALQDALDDLTAQLDQANSEENRSRSAALQNQLDVLRTLADKLTLGGTKSCGDKFFLEQQVCDSLNDAELTIQTIRQAISAYAGYRQSALESRD